MFSVALAACGTTQAKPMRMLDHGEVSVGGTVKVPGPWFDPSFGAWVRVAPLPRTDVTVGALVAPTSLAGANEPTFGGSGQLRYHAPIEPGWRLVLDSEFGVLRSNLKGETGGTWVKSIEVAPAIAYDTWGTLFGALRVGYITDADVQCGDLGPCAMGPSEGAPGVFTVVGRFGGETGVDGTIISSLGGVIDLGMAFDRDDGSKRTLGSAVIVGLATYIEL